MKDLTSFPQIYLYPAAVDFRKGRRSLAAFVESHLEESPFSATLFVFVNRKHDSIKALYWDRTGFALWEKGLEKARFPWPRPPFPKSFSLSAQQAQWLLEGVNIWKLQPHEELHFSHVI